MLNNECIPSQRPSTMQTVARCGDNVIADIDSATSTVVRTYVTPMLDANVSMTDVGTASTYYYNADERQSVMNLTDGTGAVAQTYGYTAYGDKVGALTSGTVEQRYTYTGRELSGTTEDYYFRYRWYGAASGSFMTRDPLGYVDGMSLFVGYFAMRSGMDAMGLELDILQERKLLDDCNGKKADVFKKDGKGKYLNEKKYPLVFMVISEIKKLKRWDGKECPIPTAADINCECCSVNGKYFHPTGVGQRPEIWLCYNTIHRNGKEFTLNQAALIRTLRHELIHWRNGCHRKYTNPRALDFEFDVLDEAKAYWETGVCAKAQDKQACLVEKVRLSLAGRYTPQMDYPENKKTMKKIIREYLKSQGKK